MKSVGYVPVFGTCRLTCRMGCRGKEGLFITLYKLGLLKGYRLYAGQV
jgi:hypothetical protein